VRRAVRWVEEPLITMGRIRSPGLRPQSGLQPGYRLRAQEAGRGRAFFGQAFRTFVPQFLGIRLMRAGLGDETVERLFAVYDGRVSREADLVVYWFEKARAQIKARKTSRAGLVSTNSIRGGANREVVDRIEADARLFEAWSDEPWVVEGAAVRVSIVCFGKDDGPLRLDGKVVSVIHSDLTHGAVNLTKARRLNGDDACHECNVT
jgi:hypothetical protein